MLLRSCNLFQVIAHGNINHQPRQPNIALKPTRFRYAPAVGLALRYA